MRFSAKRTVPLSFSATAIGVLAISSWSQSLTTPTAANTTPAPIASSHASKPPSANGSNLVKYVSPDTLFESDTYSKSVIVNTPSKTVYFSGAIPVDKGYNIVGRDDLRAQTKAVLKNLSLAMDAVGASKNDIVKISVSVVYKNNRDTFTVAEELAAFFERDDPPVTTITGAPFLVADGILVQIEAVAVLPLS